ncbi:MAG: aldo/keto reductase [Prochloraceae cyanobacterium]
MKYKQLGQDLKISAIGLGGMPLSLTGRPSEAEAIAVIHKALDLGVTLIDTADAYCQDESDQSYTRY